VSPVAAIFSAAQLGLALAALIVLAITFCG
jgi:hypothetical protein